MKEHTASICGVEKYAKMEVSKKQTASRLLLFSLESLDFSLSLKMEAAYSSETSMNFHL
jgi:hypothetical protein